MLLSRLWPPPAVSWTRLLARVLSTRTTLLTASPPSPRRSTPSKDDAQRSRWTMFQGWRPPPAPGGGLQPFRVPPCAPVPRSAAPAPRVSPRIGPLGRGEADHEQAGADEGFRTHGAGRLMESPDPPLVWEKATAAATRPRNMPTKPAGSRFPRRAIAAPEGQRPALAAMMVTACSTAYSGSLAAPLTCASVSASSRIHRASDSESQLRASLRAWSNCHGAMPRSLAVTE